MNLAVAMAEVANTWWWHIAQSSNQMSYKKETPSRTDEWIAQGNCSRDSFEYTCNE
uniref:Uncharacterized protein n=1 Tax=Anopheles minimus TaxID=112268 RepID=A0A182WQ46_9DIPT